MRNSHAYIIARVNNLFGGSVARLAALRREATRLSALPYMSGSKTWREARYSRFSSPYPKACAGFNGSEPIISAFSADALPVRRIQYADELLHLRHSGWYADADGARGTIRGIVASLPHGRYLPGYYGSYNGEYVLFTGRAFDDAEDAARDADAEAEKYAEQCREHNERFDAMQSAESLCEEKQSGLREAWEEYRLAFQARHVSLRHLAKYREAINDVTDAVRELRDARRELADATQAYERG